MSSIERFYEACRDYLNPEVPMEKRHIINNFVLASAGVTLAVAGVAESEPVLSLAGSGMTIVFAKLAFTEIDAYATIQSSDDVTQYQIDQMPKALKPLPTEDSESLQ